MMPIGTSTTMRNVRATLENRFGLSKHKSKVRTEILGGLTTFITMAYIIVVNPAILQTIGIPPGPSTVATILAAVFGCLLMGFWANRPIAVAPYMGENAFIAFTLAAQGVLWQQALGAVFISGAIFAALTLLKIRGWLAKSISNSMKYSFVVGIGLFLLFIGLVETGIVAKMAASETKVPVKIGDLREPRVLLASGGFMLIVTFLYWNVRGAILLGMLLTALAGYFLGLGEAPHGVAALPFFGEYDLRPIALHLDVFGVFRLSFLPILLTLFLMSFLDTLGTLVGLGSVGNMLDEKGDFPEIEKPMLVDALACMFSALVGTSTSGAYIESATGIKEGARTGLAAVTTGLLFFLALFFIPLVEPLQKLHYAYGPALMAVGVLMIGAITKIDFADLTEAVPALATIAMMVFTYNIANGLTAGLVLYPFFKILTGRFKDVNTGSIVLCLLCLVYFVFGLPH